MPYTQKYVHSMQIAFMAICFVAAGVVAIGTYLVIHQQNEIENNARNFSLQIQKQRAQLIYSSCNDQNKRRVNTIGTLNKIILNLPPKRQARAAKQEVYTILLINSIVPHQDCLKLVKQNVKPVPGVLP